MEKAAADAAETVAYLKELGFGEEQIAWAVKEAPGGNMEQLVELIVRGGLGVVREPVEPAKLDDPRKNEVRMIICVRTDLKMGVGKIASQVAHASVGLFQRLQKRDAELLERWNRNACPKICLKVNSLQELDEVEDKASGSGILTMAICDAGRTQIEAGSKTCVALCATKHKLDLVTGHLKLL